jgi:hypothetical protein
VNSESNVGKAAASIEKLLKTNEPDERCPGKLRRTRHLLPTFLGVLSALLFAELALRPWSTQLSSFNARSVSEDAVTSPILTVRNFEEGIATSHFTPSCARLTGIAPSPGAPYILIVGDSFVAGEQVQDRETMGAQVEKISAQEGHRVNVRQYGWIAAAPAKYIVEAPLLRSKWHPAMTVAVLNLDDFVGEALHDRWTTMRFAENGPSVVERVDPNAKSKSHVLAVRIASHSALLSALLERFVKTIQPRLENAMSFHHAAVPLSNQSANSPKLATNPSESSELSAPSMQQIVRESVTGLHRAYGDNLLLIYVSEPGLDDLPDDRETTLLTNCKAQGIDCVSTREGFIQARDKGQFLAAGFANSRPGAGHYNADGHRLIAQEIWRVYRQRHGEDR